MALDGENVRSAQQVTRLVRETVAGRTVKMGVLRDGKRLSDVAAFLKPYADDPNVDWVGLDYIRNALGGYELVDDFVTEMPGVFVPPEWRKLSRDERMTWLARKKIMRRDMEFVEAWEREIGVPYPWLKYDQVCVNDFVAGGMENTSATTMFDGGGHGGFGGVDGGRTTPTSAVNARQ